MCMMCEDEKSYAAYLAYLDAIPKSGKDATDANSDEAKNEAMNNVMKAMEEAARERWNRDPWAEDAANDKTLSVHSPFVCTPVEK
jgi:hypothetical protein